MSTARQRVTLMSRSKDVRIVLMIPADKADRLKDLMREDAYPSKLSWLIGRDQDRVAEGREPVLFSASQLRRIAAANGSVFDYFASADFPGK